MTIKFLDRTKISFRRTVISCDRNLIHITDPVRKSFTADTYTVPVTQVVNIYQYKTPFIFIILLWLAVTVVLYLFLHGDSTGVFIPALVSAAAGAVAAELVGNIRIGMDTASGRQYRFRMFYWNRRKANRFCSDLNRMLSGRLDDTNVSMQTDRILQAMRGK